MADPELVKILKQGSEVWNRWREQHPEIFLGARKDDDIPPGYIDIDLAGANLDNADLARVNLNSIDLGNAHLDEANLSYANLEEAGFVGAMLNGTNLSYANLREANLARARAFQADLSNANLSHASLSEADLHGTNLYGTNLSYTYLYQTYFQQANLRHADLRRALAGSTFFSHIDLREVKGLAEIVHDHPSYVELYSVQLPQDGSALHFLRGCGVPDEWIDDYRARMMYPIQYHSCFLSYSSKDEFLAHRLHADLQDRGVRCWFAPEDMKIGDKIRRRIDEAIHVHEKLLLLLSEHSIKSDWVEDEVETALEKERHQQREILFPIRLDSAAMETSQAWAAKLRRTRHIGDFTNWTDPQAYEKVFDRLLRDLKKAESQPA